MVNVVSTVCVSRKKTIDGLQPIPRDLVNKGMAAMLVEQTKQVWEKSLATHILIFFKIARR